MESMPGMDVSVMDVSSIDMSPVSSIATTATASSMAGMASMSPSTVSSAAAGATVAPNLGMPMVEGSTCKITMLWNWNTIDACFLSRSWHIKSNAMFAGSCIGIILLVLLLEFLRRLAKDYDRRIIKQHQKLFGSSDSLSSTSSPNNNTEEKTGVLAKSKDLLGRSRNANVFRPHLGQQMIRALLHMLQFAVAYFVMLLAMYYNGYILICIFIGAYLGFFVFGWEAVDLGGPKEEATLCCG